MAANETHFEIPAILQRLTALENQNELLSMQFSDLSFEKEKQKYVIKDLEREVKRSHDRIKSLGNKCQELTDLINSLKQENNVGTNKEDSAVTESKIPETIQTAQKVDINNDNAREANDNALPQEVKMYEEESLLCEDEVSGAHSSDVEVVRDSVQTSAEFTQGNESVTEVKEFSSETEENKSETDEPNVFVNEEKVEMNGTDINGESIDNQTELYGAEVDQEDHISDTDSSLCCQENNGCDCSMQNIASMDTANTEEADCTILEEALAMHGPELIEGMDANAVLTHLEDSLSLDEISHLHAKNERMEKNSRILDMVTRKLWCGSRLLHSKFLRTLAGLHPWLFKELAGREPKDEEENACIALFRESLKQNILEEGHRTDSHSDIRINFESDFVMLNLVSDLSSEEGQIPGHYKSHLEKTAELLTNIAITDILPEGGVRTKILITGRGGIGKTTSMQWLFRQWALGTWGQQFSLAFMISLRILTTCDLRISLVELLTMYGLYRASMMAERHLSQHWLSNHSRKVLIQLDGLDEVRNITARLNTAPEITDVNTKSHPLDLIVNILRGNLLPEATLIAASRPFLSLKDLVKDPAIYEIRGLTQGNIKDYVANNYPEVKDDLLKALHSNPILLSVCAITFYCTVISKVLSDDPGLSTKGIDTYTRLQSFILQKYTCRKSESTSFGLETCKILPKLAHLASRGIFDVQSGEEIMRLVFTERDLVKVKLDTEDVEKAGRNSIIQATKIDSSAHILVEFFHLSVQELLATVHAIDGSEKNTTDFENILKKISTDGSFNMALMYLFGLFYDKDNEWISRLLDIFDVPEESSTCKKLMEQLLKKMEKIARDSGDIQMRLQLCHLAHESQSPDIAKQVASTVVKSGKVIINSHTMTAVDTKALLFACEHDDSLRELVITNANMDDFSIQKICTFINANPNVTKLDLSHNKLHIPGLLSLKEMTIKNCTLKALILESTGITDKTLSNLLPGLRTNTGLTHLSLANNLLSDDSSTCIAECNEFCERLEILDLSKNMFSSYGAQAIIGSMGGRGKSSPKAKLILDNNNNIVNNIEQTVQKSAYAGIVSCSTSSTMSLMEIHRSPKFKEAESIYLNRMNLDDTDFGHIAPNLTGHVHLKYLNLNVNRLTEQSMPWLDTIVLTCPELTSIKLLSNTLDKDSYSDSEILRKRNESQYLEARAQHKSFSDPASTKFYLPIDPMANMEILSSVLKVQALTRLCIDLTGCSKKIETMPSAMNTLISCILEQNMSLKTLELASLQLSSVESEGNVEPLVYNIIKLGHLTSLKIVHSRVGRRELAVLGQSKSITEMMIDSDCHESNGSFWNYVNPWNAHTDTIYLLKDFSKVIQANVVLRHLTLSNISMGKNLVELSKILSQNRIKIRTLKIHKCTISEKGVSALAQAVITNDKLRSLILTSNTVKPQSLAVLCKGIKNNNSITKLKIGMHSCSEEDFAQFTLMVQKNVCIETLDISCIKSAGCCKMNSTSAQSFVSALAKNKLTALSTLDLSGHTITIEGMSTLCGALKWAETLKRLYMKKVQLSDAHMPPLCDYIKVPTSLQCLDLRCNSLVTSAKDLWNALNQNSTIKTLGLPEILEDPGALRRMFNWPRNEKWMEQFRALLTLKDIKEMLDSQGKK